MKILIADNNARMREFIKYIVNEQGHTTIEASNGLMAVDNFLFHKPDIVIMSLRLKVMDGIEATRLIRKISSTVKIIIVTDYNEEKLRLSALSAGINKYLLKENLIELKEALYLDDNQV